MSLQRNLILALKLAEEKVRVSILKASFGYSLSQLKLPISYLIKILSFLKVNIFQILQFCSHPHIGALYFFVYFLRFLY